MHLQPVVDLANTQFVCIGMRLNRFDARHHHVIERLAGRIDTVDFQSGKGYQRYDFVSIFAGVHPAAKPLFTYSHGVLLRR